MGKLNKFCVEQNITLCHSKRIGLLNINARKIQLKIHDPFITKKKMKQITHYIKKGHLWPNISFKQEHNTFSLERKLIEFQVWQLTARDWVVHDSHFTTFPPNLSTRYGLVLLRRPGCTKAVYAGITSNLGPIKRMLCS